MAEKESTFGDKQVPRSRFGGTRLEDIELLDDTREPRKIIEEDTAVASGVTEALISGLTNDENAKVFYLASKRFPELVEQGKDPSLYYAFDEDGELFYRDPYTGDYKREFGQDLFGFEVDYLDNVGPAGQFLAEVIPGSMGLTGGFIAGGFPGAVAGGGAGTAVGGGTFYGLRAGLSALLEGPPLDVEKAATDLSLSSLMGALPIGVPAKSAPEGIAKFLRIFPGSDGRTALADIVQNGGRTVDEKLAYMAERYPDVKISRAEANDLIGNRGYKIEAFLAKTARTDELAEHYADRNQRVLYHAERFFDDIASGALLPRARGKSPAGQKSLDPEFDVAEAAAAYLEKEKKRLQEITAPMYREAYDLEGVVVDLSDLLKQVDDVIADPNVSKERLKAYQDMRKALIDARFGDNTPRSQTELIHNGLKDNFNRLISRLTKDLDGPLKREVSLIRDQISQRLKAANPLYEKVTKIYDEGIGSSQSLDRSIVGQLADALEKGGSRIAPKLKKFFSGDIKPAEIETLKNALQSTEEGARAWQNLKGTWLSTRMNDVIQSNTNPLSQPNAFLRAVGIRQPKAAFPQEKVIYDPFGLPIQNVPMATDELARLAKEVDVYKAKGKMAEMWKAILEPDELQAFIDLTGMMQMVGKIQTLGGSDTFGNISMNILLANEAKQVLPSTQVGRQAAKRAGGILASIASIPSRITAQGFRDLMTRANATQLDAYKDLLISHIIDPKKTAELQMVLDSVKPISYIMGQAALRGGPEALTALFEDIEEKNQSLEESQQERLEQRQEDLRSMQTPVPDVGAQMEMVQPPSLDLPLFEDIDTGTSTAPIDPAVSAIVLPRDEDRELAMRLRQRQGGIGSLS